MNVGIPTVPRPVSTPPGAGIGAYQPAASIRTSPVAAVMSNQIQPSSNGARSMSISTTPRPDPSTGMSAEAIAIRVPSAFDRYTCTPHPPATSTRNTTDSNTVHRRQYPALNPPEIRRETHLGTRGN
ncbi:hypothetical protein WSS_A38261 [Rhodococcus opacus M213]|uniref:Uncharacterized protein n=1 Tax=Rhodococcus opacus M213 TaxID=1129896 RepID=K8X784_RHOOP|nr:hypothetical protein WSS_A38261 [Rhodococcus opacus M213]